MCVALATCERPPVPDSDAEVLVPALEELGARAELVPWSDPEVEWGSFDLVLLSSTWDYHERLDAFRAWLRRAAAATRVENPPPLVEWNLDKRYLRELEGAGVPVIPTLWGEPGAAPPAVRERGWDELVVKPAVDLGAARLIRTDASGLADAAGRMGGAYLVQPFLSSLERAGELSLVLLDGELSHALRKRPAAGDFRVQPQYGGTHEPAEAPPEAVEIAVRALAVAGSRPLYARVDLVEGLDGSYVCIELELVEPLLFLVSAGDAAARFARLIVSSRS